MLRHTQYNDWEIIVDATIIDELESRMENFADISHKRKFGLAVEVEDKNLPQIHILLFHYVQCI